MSTFWQAVLTSSLVSTFVTSIVTIISSRRTESRLASSMAHEIAWELEDFIANCRRDIIEADTAIAERNGAPDSGAFSRLSFPKIQISSSGLERLAPKWRDRIRSFPTQVTEREEYVLNEWTNSLDEEEFLLILQEVVANLGITAFALSESIRLAHRLPVEDMKNQHDQSLNLFKQVISEKNKRNAIIQGNNQNFQQ